MKFVDLSRYKFVLEPIYYFYGWSKSPKILARRSVVKALLKARIYLPKGYNFKIWDCQRPRYVQIAMLSSFRRRFKTLNPKLSPKEIEKLVFTFGARPLPKVVRLDTHRNGGAVDLTILGKSGEELYMGTEFDDLTPKAATNYYVTKQKLTAADKEAKKNRQLLCRIMVKAGFKNYAPEWWHWMTDK